MPQMLLLLVLALTWDVASPRALLSPNTNALDSQMDKLAKEIQMVSQNLATPDMDADFEALRQRLKQLQFQNVDLRARFKEAERTDERMRAAIRDIATEEVERAIQSKEEIHRQSVKDIAQEAVKILQSELEEGDNATKTDDELLDEAKEDEAEREALKDVLKEQAKAKLRGGIKEDVEKLEEDEVEEGAAEVEG